MHFRSRRFRQLFPKWCKSKNLVSLTLTGHGLLFIEILSRPNLVSEIDVRIESDVGNFEPRRGRGCYTYLV